MTIRLSAEQLAITTEPLGPMCITACAGSGKTQTAVHRLIKMREMVDDHHTVIALLSFSNVAVNTFRNDYQLHLKSSAQNNRGCVVEIDTVDSFITKHILRPHAYRTMNATRSAYLVQGSEPFTNSFKIWHGGRYHFTMDLSVGFDGADFTFEVPVGFHKLSVAASLAIPAIERLGAIGAYTHSIGRYWTYRSLKDQPFVLRALVRRFRHIIIDEAQDIGAEHQAIIELMIKAGSQVTLIGDVNQGIFEFSGATSSFLRDHDGQSTTLSRDLTVNFRSAPSILAIANSLTGRSDTPDRVEPATLSGPFYIAYNDVNRDALLSAFHALIKEGKISPGNAAVVCRGNDLTAIWSGLREELGRGVVKTFAHAVINRDKFRKYDIAFRLAVSGIVRLLADDHSDLNHRLSKSMQYPELRSLRRLIWSFVKDPSTGLPSGNLPASTTWHSQLKSRLQGLLATLQTDHRLMPAANFGNKLAKTDLGADPLITAADLASGDEPPLRTSTVHQVKGESIDAVMYIAKKPHIEAFLGGTTSEVGRIGYVALTRARNIFVLAVPSSCIAEFEPRLASLGFRKPGSS